MYNIFWELRLDRRMPTIGHLTTWPDLEEVRRTGDGQRIKRNEPNEAAGEAERIPFCEANPTRRGAGWRPFCETNPRSGRCQATSNARDRIHGSGSGKRGEREMGIEVESRARYEKCANEPEAGRWSGIHNIFWELRLDRRMPTIGHLTTWPYLEEVRRTGDRRGIKRNEPNEAACGPSGGRFAKRSQ
jgi:hypothetical protein